MNCLKCLHYYYQSNDSIFDPFHYWPPSSLLLGGNLEFLRELLELIPCCTCILRTSGLLDMMLSISRSFKSMNLSLGLLFFWMRFDGLAVCRMCRRFLMYDVFFDWLGCWDHVVEQYGLVAVIGLRVGTFLRSRLTGLSFTLEDVCGVNTVL